jgi:PAS domain S-box-containing protein
MFTTAFRRTFAGGLAQWLSHRRFATQVIAIHIATLAAVMVLLAVASYSHVKAAAHALAAEISDSRLQGLALDLQRLPVSAAETREVERRLENHLSSPRYINGALLSAKGRVIASRRPTDPPLQDPGPQPTSSGWRILASGQMRTWTPLPSGDGYFAATVDLASVDTTVRDVGRALLALFLVLAVTGGAVFGAVIVRHLRGLEGLVRWTRDHATRMDVATAGAPLDAIRSPELRSLGQALQEVMVQRTEQLQAKEDALSVLHKVIDAAPAAIVVIDLGGIVRLCNRAMERQFGWLATDLSNAPISQILGPADEAGFLSVINEFAADRDRADGPLTIDRAIIRGDGSLATARLFGELMELSSAPLVCLFLRDMTSELRDAQALADALAAARQSAEAKSRFLATMSHEIRTPLNGIAGMLDLLGRSSPSMEQREYIDIMRTSTRLLRNLLNDILDLSKIEAGRMELEHLPFDLEQHLRDACAPFKALADGRGIRFSAEFRVRHTMVVGDPFRLSQILNNLLDNALKFTADGGVLVDVGGERPDPATGRVVVRIAVMDTGIGIPKPLQAKLFSAFSQADETVTRRYGGTGLGLALCRQLARMMDGDIEVASVVGEGSRFDVTVSLPATEAKTAFMRTQPDAFAEESGRQLANRLILVVDDNRINQLLLQKWLRLEGARVEVAVNGEDALGKVGVRHYDAILMDVSMPVMNGYDAARAIRAMGQPSGRPQGWGALVPIIGVTALSMGGEREQCQAAGMNDCITKPVDRATLIRKLAPLVAGRDAQAAASAPAPLPQPSPPPDPAPPPSATTEPPP